LILPIALLAAGCGSPVSSPTASAGVTAGDVPGATTSSVAPTPPNRSTSPSASLAAGQTDTDWGRIWDTVPAGFPRFPGSTVAHDAGPDPASARFSVPGGDPKTIATWIQGALEEAGLDTVGLNGPAEDGSFVLDSVGAGECRAQTTIAPLGDITFISVLYGSDCPATRL
jgi:hypothetical protein